MTTHDDDQLEEIATNILTSGGITFIGSLFIRRKGFQESLKAGIMAATLVGGAHLVGKIVAEIPGLDQYDNTAKLAGKVVRGLGGDIIDVTTD